MKNKLILLIVLICITYVTSISINDISEGPITQSKKSLQKKNKLQTVQSVRKANPGLNRKQAAKVARNRNRPKNKSSGSNTKKCPATYKLSDKNVNDLGNILKARMDEKPSGIDGQYDLLLAAIEKGKAGPLKLLAEDILNCFGEKSGCAEGCNSFSNRIYGSDFEPNDHQQNIKKLKFLTFWSGTSYAKKTSEKLANQTGTEFIDMCAGTVAGELLTGWGPGYGSGIELNKWFKSLKNNEEIDIGAGNQNLWTPMSKILADKWFRPGINAVGLLDYYRKYSGNYFHNDEFPLLASKQTDKNRLVLMVHKSCSIIEKAIKHVFGKDINLDTDKLAPLNLRNGCPHRHCVGGYKSSNFKDASEAAPGTAQRKAYDDLDDEFKKAFKGYPQYYNSLWLKNNWLIFAFKEKEILCTVAQIREFVLNRRDKGLTAKKLSNVIVGTFNSDDDQHLKEVLGRLVRIRKAEKVAGRRRSPKRRSGSRPNTPKRNAPKRSTPKRNAPKRNAPKRNIQQKRGRN